MDGIFSDVLIKLDFSCCFEIYFIVRIPKKLPESKPEYLAHSMHSARKLKPQLVYFF